MANSENRLDPLKQKEFGEHITKPKIDKILHDRGNVHDKMLDNGLDTDGDGILNRVLGTVKKA